MWSDQLLQETSGADQRSDFIGPLYWFPVVTDWITGLCQKVDWSLQFFFQLSNWRLVQFTGRLWPSALRLKRRIGNTIQHRWNGGGGVLLFVSMIQPQALNFGQSWNSTIFKSACPCKLWYFGVLWRDWWNFTPFHAISLMSDIACVLVFLC